MDSDHRDATEPFDTNATLMTEAAALKHARGVHSDAPATAVLARYGDIAAANPALAASARVHPDRLAWVVTVHADVMTRGSIAWPPQRHHVYSMVINAELGSLPEFKDVGVGNEAVRDGKLVVKPARRGHHLGVAGQAAISHTGDVDQEMPSRCTGQDRQKGVAPCPD